MKDLLKLDEIGGENLRAKRKEEVTKIQHIMDGIEIIINQIHDLELGIKPEADKLEAEQEAKNKEIESQEAKALVLKERQEELKRSIGSADENAHIVTREKQDSEDEQKSPKERDKKDGDKKIEDPKDLWRELKLDVNFQTSEKSKFYMIIGNIPGMVEKDIKIKVDGNKLIVSGFRGPNQQEIELMHRNLRKVYGIPKTKEAQLMALLKMGYGRFGTFIKTFHLPKDANPDKVQASYNHGVLKVIIHKIYDEPSQNIWGIPQDSYQNMLSQQGFREADRQRGNRGFLGNPNVWW